MFKFVGSFVGGVLKELICGLKFWVCLFCCKVDLIWKLLIVRMLLLFSWCLFFLLSGEIEKFINNLFVE